MRLRSSGFLLVLALCSSVALAQTPPGANPPPAPDAPAIPATPPTTLQSAPSPAQTEPRTPAAPQAPATAQPSPTTRAPANPAGPGPAQQAGRTTLFPNPSDPTGVEEGVLVAKPAVVLNGISTWDEAFANLKSAFTKIEDELKKAGIAPTGRPVTIFVDTDDNGFKYEAMVPIERVPEGKTELTPEIKFGKTPEGRSFRFVHKDAYDEIDGTYETITAYLDIKEIVAKDAFIEEYVSDFTDSQDTNFEVNIYVQPKE